MKINIFQIILLLLLPIAGFAQHAPCGTLALDDEGIERLLRNKAYAAEHADSRTNVISWAPIQFHAIARNDESGRIKEHRILDALCKLNEEFIDHDLQFYMKGATNYINNTNMYELEDPGDSWDINYQSHKVNGAINVFIGEIQEGAAGFFAPFFDIVHMDKGYVNRTHNVFSHEMGHFLSLPHTFNGWEGEDIEDFNNTPSSIGGTPVEYVDRDINCESSGDYFCGTQADYYSSGGSSCNHNGGAVDPDGVLLDPDEANFMAYFNYAPCPEFYFSEDQADAMWADYEQSSISNLPDPEVLEVEDVATLVYPINGEPVPLYDEITFSWEPVENAEFYILQASRVPGFDFTDEYVMTTNTSFTSTNCYPDREEYYWRVMAYNRTFVCDIDFCENGIFSTGTVSASNDIDFIDDLNLFPNPVTEVLNVAINSSETNEVEMEVYDNLGRLIYQTSNQLNTGNDVYSIDIQNFANGFYFLKITSGQRFLTEHFVIEK